LELAMTNRISHLSTENLPASGTMAALPAGFLNANSNAALRQVYELAQRQAAISVQNRQWHALLRKLLECDDDA
jgi:hypothetical protein